MMFIFVFFKSFIVFIFVELASSIFIINKMNNKPQRCTRLQSQILLLGEEFECPLPLRERLGLATIENVSSGRGLLRLKKPRIIFASSECCLWTWFVTFRKKNPLPEAKGGLSANNNHTPRRQSFLQAMEAFNVRNN
jgi:hypothetical protein